MTRTRLPARTVAYGAANIASALPLTSGGLGVMEVILVVITVAFGAPRATAVLAILAYRIADYWLPLPFGAVACLRLRAGPADRGPPRPQPVPGLADGQPGDERR